MRKKIKEQRTYLKIQTGHSIENFIFVGDFDIERFRDHIDTYFYSQMVEQPINYFNDKGELYLTSNDEKGNYLGKVSRKFWSGIENDVIYDIVFKFNKNFINTKTKERM